MQNSRGAGPRVLTLLTGVEKIRVGSEGTGSAKDGADIVRVGELIEHDNKARVPNIVEPEAADRLHLKRHALVHGVGTE